MSRQRAAHVLCWHEQCQCAVQKLLTSKGLPLLCSPRRVAASINSTGEHRQSGLMEAGRSYISVELTGHSKFKAL